MVATAPACQSTVEASQGHHRVAAAKAARLAPLKIAANRPAGGGTSARPCRNRQRWLTLGAVASPPGADHAIPDNFAGDAAPRDTGLLNETPATKRCAMKPGRSALLPAGARSAHRGSQRARASTGSDPIVGQCVRSARLDQA